MTKNIERNVIHITEVIQMLFFSANKMLDYKIKNMDRKELLVDY